MGVLRTDRTAQVVITGLAFLQNLRRGQYELATESPRQLGAAAAFTEPVRRSEQQTHPGSPCSPNPQCNGAMSIVLSD